jgi:hypothetical protein
MIRFYSRVLNFLAKYHLSGYLVIWLFGVRHLMKIITLIIAFIVVLLTFTGMYVSATMDTIGESC